MTTTFAYDVVEYPSAALPQAHPGHLYAVARLFGCDPARVEHCRYLELGCGDGTHLIACAMGLPEATFVGVDLSAAAIERGHKLVAELGVTNVSLFAADITEWTPPGGGFDYAAAHGLYSWVPPVVRDAVMATISSALLPHGIGYVSYNVYPGCYLRQMVWEMMRRHTAHTDDPPQKIRESMDLLKFLLAGQPTENRKPTAAVFAHELTRLVRENYAGALYHDDLGEVNDPIYFQQFVEHAGEHGLRFVCESEPEMTETRAFPPAVANILDGMAAKDVTVKEQYLDYLRLRRFRQTLLAKDGRPPLARPDQSRVPELAVSGQLTVEGDTTDLTSSATVSFRHNEAMVQTDNPVCKATMMTLAERGPGRITFADLASAISTRLRRGAPTADDLRALAAILIEAWMVGVIELHGHIPKYADRVSERPKACPFARARGRIGGAVTSRLFKNQAFDDVPIRRLLEVLDGTRTVDEITTEVMEVLPPDARPTPAELRTTIDEQLTKMARDGLLVE